MCRIKSLSTLSHPVLGVDGTSPSRTALLSTVSSDGLINLYNLSAALESVPASNDATPTVSPVASYDTKGSRLTCVFLADGKKAQMGGSRPAGGQGTAKNEDVEGEGAMGEAIDDADEDEEDEEDDEDEDDGEDMYDQGSEAGSGDEEGLDGVDVEFEDDEDEEEEEEEEQEEEGEDD